MRRGGEDYDKVGEIGAELTSAPARVAPVCQCNLIEPETVEPCRSKAGGKCLAARSNAKKGSSLARVDH